MIAEIDISASLAKLADRNNVLIASFEILPPDIRAHFQQQRRKALLVWRSRVYEREISPLADGRIDIFDTSLCSVLAKGERLLLVLPAGQSLRYVLQVVVEGVFVDRFRLRALDPRRFRRHVPAGPAGCRCWQVGEALLFLLENGRIGMGRETGGGGEGDDHEAAPELSRQVVDILFEKPGRQVSEYQEQLTQAPPLEGRVLDVSLGGLRLALRGAEEVDLVNRLLYVECIFGAAGTETPSTPPGEAGCLVRVFAIARRRQLKADSCVVHLMFAETLPAAMETLLAG
ncbi:MAG: hypothetical protein AB1568_13340 [Thermodesulfobacteriota bacterium]